MSALSFQFFICISSQFSPSSQKCQFYSPCVLQKNSCTKAHQRKTCIFVITGYEREGKGTCFTLHKGNIQDRNHPGAISYPQTPPSYTMVCSPPPNSICLGSIACLSLQLCSLLIYKTVPFHSSFCSQNADPNSNLGTAKYSQRWLARLAHGRKWYDDILHILAFKTLLSLGKVHVSREISNN